MRKIVDKDLTGGSKLLRVAWRRSLGGLCTIFFFGAFINVLKLAMPLYTLQILDRIPASRSVETLVMLTAIALVAVVTGVALDAVRRRMLARWGAWIEGFFGPHLFRSGIAGKSGGLAARTAQSLGDLSTLRTFAGRSAASWLDVIWAPAFVVAVYLVHPVLGAIQLVALLLLLIIGVAQERMTRDPRRATGNASNNARRIVRAAERNRETVGGLGMAPNLTERWSRSVARGLDERDRTEARTAVFMALMQGLYRCLYVTGLGVGIWLAINNSLTLGGVIAGNIMLRFGFRLVAKPIRKWRSLVNAQRAYKRLKARLDIADSKSVSVSQSDLNAALTFEKASFRYPGQSNPVFRRLDLVASPGEILCVIGPSAAGKSTLVRLFTGVLSPRSGQVRLGDVAIGRLPVDIKAQLVGFLPQDIRLFKGSVRDNIAGLANGNFEDVVEAARLANIHNMIVRLPQGYDSEIDDEAPCLSGGERKLIALARAYYSRPRLLVLDEPEANLDRASRKALGRALQLFKSWGAIVVVTTQYGRLGKISDKVLILGRGNARVRRNDEEDEPSSSNVVNPFTSDRRAERRKWSESNDGA